MKRILGRKIAHRRSMLRNLVTSLILYEKIDTTLPKAKEAKSMTEKIIFRAKSKDLNSYKSICGYLFDKKAAQKIRDELVDRYASRNSGFVQMYKMPNRLGDNSKMARLELVDRKVFIESSDIKESKSKIKEEKVLEKKSNKRLEKKLDKLSATQNKDGVNTLVRTKASRKTGV